MRIRHLAAIATVATLGTVAFTPLTALAALRAGPSTQRLGTLYAAVAYSPSHHSTVAIGGGKTVTDAEITAIKNCGKSDCLPVGWARHAYVAFYVGNGDAWGWGAYRTAQGADKTAMYYCDRYGGTGCHLVRQAVTTSPSSKGFAWSDLMGRACVFNAPKGGISFNFDGQHISGHVGWAYLMSRDTGQWEFGANEGPEHNIYAFPSKTWLAQSTWGELLTVFREALPSSGANKNYYHKKNYYKTFRCVSTASNNSAAALSQATSEYGEPYKIPGADCLAQVTSVLRVYGAPISEYAYLINPYYWVPNHYYESSYMSEFEPEKPV